MRNTLEELYLAKHLPYYNNMPLFNNYTTVTAAEHTLQLSFAGTLTLASITILGNSYSLNLCIIMLFPTQYLKVFISLVFPMMLFHTVLAWETILVIWDNETAHSKGRA